MITMTKEDIKRQLDKFPLEWKEEVGRPFYSLYSIVTLIDGEGGGDDECNALRISFHVDVNEAKKSSSVEVCASGKWEFGNYEIASSKGCIIPLEVLKGKAEDCRLSIACRLLGINE